MEGGQAYPDPKSSESATGVPYPIVVTQEQGRRSHWSCTSCDCYPKVTNPSDHSGRDRTREEQVGESLRDPCAARAGAAHLLPREMRPLDSPIYTPHRSHYNGEFARPGRVGPGTTICLASAARFLPKGAEGGHQGLLEDQSCHLGGQGKHDLRKSSPFAVCPRSPQETPIWISPATPPDGSLGQHSLSYPATCAQHTANQTRA